VRGCRSRPVQFCPQRTLLTGGAETTPPAPGLMKSWSFATRAFPRISVRRFPPLAKGGLGGVIAAPPVTRPSHALCFWMSEAPAPPPWPPLRKGGKGFAGSRRRLIGRNKNAAFKPVPSGRLTPAFHQPPLPPPSQGGERNPAHRAAVSASGQFSPRRWHRAINRCVSGPGRRRWQEIAARKAVSGRPVFRSCKQLRRYRSYARSAARSRRRSHLHRRHVSAHSCRAPQVGQRISP